MYFSLFFGMLSIVENVRVLVLNCQLPQLLKQKYYLAQFVQSGFLWPFLSTSVVSTWCLVIISALCDFVVTRQRDSHQLALSWIRQQSFLVQLAKVFLDMVPSTYHQSIGLHYCSIGLLSYSFNRYPPHTIVSKMVLFDYKIHIHVLFVYNTFFLEMYVYF